MEHQPRLVMQRSPVDHSSQHVNNQIDVWQVYGTLVHTDIARGIAGWWAYTSTPAITMFAKHGKITADLVPEIRAERKQHVDGTTDAVDLDALLAYLEAAAPQPAVADA